MALRGAHDLALTVGVAYRIVPTADAAAGWRISLGEYAYTLYRHVDDDFRELLAYHWHPEAAGNVPTPHLHLEAGAAIGWKPLTRAVVTSRSPVKYKSPRWRGL